MSRWKACAIHFSISLAVFAGLLAVILYFWYPGILFSVGGGWAGLRIVFAVDIILGPLLTLIVFRSGKPGLKFDLSCIAVFQIACMTAGMGIVYAERPLALVLAYDTFYSLDTDELLEYDRDPELLERFPGAYPKLIYIELPESDIAADVANMRGQFVGDPLYVQTELYREFPEQPAEIRRIFRREASAKSAAPQSVLKQLDESCVFSKFVSSVTSGFVCFDVLTRRLDKFYASGN
ncbi:MAG: hypothetical protein WDZ52_06355 [Pseudohongiellaceae bacterium]